MTIYRFKFYTGTPIDVQCDSYSEDTTKGVYKFTTNGVDSYIPMIKIKDVKTIEKLPEPIEGVLID